ncbi:MAG: transcriptional repressor [Lachnospiraceae bacterium]|nr:transcriptional repressor [Lachnospiraceae bacterium]
MTCKEKKVRDKVYNVRNRKMKNEYKTKTRLAIVEFLRENADTRFTARDVLNAVNKLGNNLDRSTVYRNLERLCMEGRLVKYRETDINATCYQYSEEHGSCHDHMHAQCSECGRIFHLDNSVLDDAAKRIKAEYGLEINYGKTVIIGVCDECKELDGEKAD